MVAAESRGFDPEEGITHPWSLTEDLVFMALFALFLSSIKLIEIVR